MPLSELKPEGFDELAKEIFENTGPDEYTEALCTALDFLDRYPDYIISDATLAAMYQETFESMKATKEWAIDEGLWAAADPYKVVHVLYNNLGEEVYAGIRWCVQDNEEQSAKSFLETYNSLNDDKAEAVRTVTPKEYEKRLEEKGDRYAGI